VLTTLRLMKSSKRKFHILKELTGSIQPVQCMQLCGAYPAHLLSSAAVLGILCLLVLAPLCLLACAVWSYLCDLLFFCGATRGRTVAAVFHLSHSVCCVSHIKFLVHHTIVQTHGKLHTAAVHTRVKRSTA